MSSRFSIGRSQIVKADVRSHQMVVLRGGSEVARYGLDSDPNRNTRSGLHVVTEKFTDKRMVNERYGHDVMEKWADAKAYYDTAMYGDPVEVTGSGVALPARDGDIWDWTLSWEQWSRLSALS